METVDNINAVLEAAECLYSFNEINEALDRLATEITQLLKESNPIILCVMSGAMIPAGHMLTRLHFPLEVGYLHVTRYRGTNRGGDLHWLVEPRQNLKNRTVLVIDDIMDGGLTLSAIIDCAGKQNALMSILL